MKVKLILLGIFIVLIGLGVVFYLYQKPVESTKHMPPDMHTNAVALVQDFTESETVANEQYLNKVLSVTGQVSDIENMGDIITIYLDAGNPMSRVVCEMEGDETIISLSIGNLVTIKGVCSGFLMDVILSRCVLITE